MPGHGAFSSWFRDQGAGTVRTRWTGTAGNCSAHQRSTRRRYAGDGEATPPWRGVDFSESDPWLAGSRPRPGCLTVGGSGAD